MSEPKEDRLWVYLQDAAWEGRPEFSWKRVADKARELLQDHGPMCNCQKCEQGLTKEPATRACDHCHKVFLERYIQEFPQDAPTPSTWYCANCYRKYLEGEL
jgi:hypothetical protein